MARLRYPRHHASLSDLSSAQTTAGRLGIAHGIDRPTFSALAPIIENMRSDGYFTHGKGSEGASAAITRSAVMEPVPGPRVHTRSVASATIAARRDRAAGQLCEDILSAKPSTYRCHGGV